MDMAMDVLAMMTNDHENDPSSFYDKVYEDPKGGGI